MKAMRVLTATAATVAIGVTGAVSAAAAGPATRTPSSTAAGLQSRVCPAGIRPLPANGVARAADQALTQAAALFGGLNTRGAKVMAADRSAFAGVRGSEVRHLCGARVAARTVVVQLLFPRMLPSASLSQGVVFVGRFGQGYRVWFVAH